MKTIALAIAVAVVACTTVDTNTTEQKVCTIEDQEAGTCGDPGGGGSPATLQYETSTFGTSFILDNYSGLQIVPQVVGDCTASSCTVRFNFGTWWIDSTCTQAEEFNCCSASVCEYTDTGFRCTMGRSHCT